MLKNIKEKYLLIDDCMLDKVLDKIKAIISIDKLDDTKILININDKLPDGNIFINVVILMACVIKDDGKFYQQVFLEEALFVEKSM